MTPLGQPSNRPGQMTAVMRAMPQPTGERALRAALVRGGKILEERVLAPGEHLTVGPNERSTFVIAGLSSSVRLLEWSRAGYRLHLGPGMVGRVATSGAIAEVSERANGRVPVALDGAARGKITCGDALVLFHFVDPQVAAAQPQLPVALRKGAFDDLDWKTTFIAAFSFLLHFGAMGAVYSDFADGTLDDDGARVTQAIGILRDLPSPPPVEVRSDDASSAPTPSASPRDPSPQAPGRTASAGPARGRLGAPSGGAERAADARARDIARQLAAEGGIILSAIGGAGNNPTDRVLRAGEDTSLGLLDGAATSASGARSGGVAGLSMNASPGTVRPGAGQGCASCVADKKRDGTADDLGKQTGPKKVTGTTVVSPPETPVGELPDAGKVVNGLRGLLRACYQRELEGDPTAKGTVRLTATVGPNGEVKSVQAAVSGLSSSMVSCVSRVVRGAPFGVPKGGSAIVAIPMSFYPQ
jgi:hypothetical protein